ncbi:hypothetical protein J6500_07220 [Bradyrhizobium sp. WSM 1704]|nr:hypothetical protein [Bradyrhizobium semiaridum]
MVDRRLEQLRAHRNNIQRYRRLLRTQLTELERSFIERRLTEELSAMKTVAEDMPPLITQEQLLPRGVARAQEARL